MKKVQCSFCGKKHKLNVHYTVTLNYFNWWMYQLVDFESDEIKTKVVKGTSRLWWLGKIPIVDRVVPYVWRKFNKRKMLDVYECEECENV